MRQLGLLILFISILLGAIIPILGQPTSCTDTFRDFDILTPDVNPTIRSETYHPIMTWYEDCLLIGSYEGLWLYDPTQPENAVQLAQLSSRAINNIAVNPLTATIAFNVAQEARLYLIDTDMTASTIDVSGDSITDITFSADGAMLAVASSALVDGDISGFYADARTEIWDSSGEKLVELVSDRDYIPTLSFHSDNQHILTLDVNPGYFGDNLIYWIIDSASVEWNYWGLLAELQPQSNNDPLSVMSMAMNGEIVAIGGVEGFYNDRNFYGLGVHLWNVQTQDRQLEITLSGHLGNETIYTMPTPRLTFNTNGSVLAVYVQGIEAISFFDADNGDLMHEMNIQDIQIREFSFSPNDTYFSILTDENVILFDTETMQEVTSFPVVNIE